MSNELIYIIMTNFRDDLIKVCPRGFPPLTCKIWHKIESKHAKLSIFSYCDAHFSVSKMSYWAGNFEQWVVYVLTG